MKKMKLLFGVVAISLLSASFTSCKKDNDTKNENSDNDDIYANVQMGNVPERLKGKTLNDGSTSATWYFTTAGPYEVHPSEESLRTYEISADGKTLFAQSLSTYSNGCYNMAISFYKGAMYFTDNTMKWTALEGTFRKKFCNAAPSDRKADQDDLNRSSRTYYWRIRTLADGKDYFETYLDAGMTQLAASYRID